MYLINEDYTQQREAGTRILESTNLPDGAKQVTIETILQTCDDVNKNNRIYPRELMSNAIREITPMVKAKQLTGELDHPVPTGVSETDSYRHFVVLYDRVSHIIEDVSLKGNNIMGIVKTASTQRGKDLAGLISDGVPVGFSLRAMGESETLPNGTTKIKAPLSIITWDCVSNPSHPKARMQSVVKENFSNMVKSNNTTALLEGEFGAGTIALDRSSVLKTMFSPRFETREERYARVMECIDRMVGEEDSTTLKYMSRLFEDYLGEPVDFSKEYNEGYLNTGLAPIDQIHMKLLDYLEEYLDVNKTSPDMRDFALFSKHFLKKQ